MNRLASERSPYLLQHRTNPVDWMPWGEEAFERARREEKPIFLSVGYSTCHWCHVMAHESFENDAVAEVLNRAFVSIKVDREERPDVDRIYMTFVQVTTGGGGWPMSVWMTPALEPFYGGTYFPPTSRWGRPGFVDILTEIARLWRNERERVVQSAGDIVRRLQDMIPTTPASAPVVPGVPVLDAAVRQFSAAFDRRHGGFGQAPKFPRPSELLFLLREHWRSEDDDALAMALGTLRAMALGGMRDHLGGGFHRYSVDAEWRVPHFEKMLYDQAQLVLAYLEAAQASGDAFYADVAAETLAYVERDLRDPLGGFYSAEDADSVAPDAPPGTHATEGAFYLWRDEELRSALGDDAEVFRLRYGIEREGNAPADPHGDFAQRNLLYVARSVEEVAGATRRSPQQIDDALARARALLFRMRETRPRPHLDDKALSAWNGLMIAAFARAARVLPDGRARWQPVAQAAAEFLLAHLWDEPRRVLLRRYRAGESAIDGYAEDYAFVIFGLLELFQTSGDPRWLEWGRRLQHRQDELFWDADGGGWFSTTGTDPRVLLRLKEDYDGAEPAASSVSVLNLIQLAHMESDPGAAERIQTTLGSFAERLQTLPRGVPMMLAALSTLHAGVSQIVIVGPTADPRTSALVEAARGVYLPGAVLIPIDPAKEDDVARVLPWTRGMTMRDGAPTAYVCHQFACQAPVTEGDALRAQLEHRRTWNFT